MSPDETPEQRQAAKRHALEMRHTLRRITELELDPVAGRFDSDHLREIHRRIFQDLPRLGFPDVTPGEYREPVPYGTWIKRRSLRHLKERSIVAYADMDDTARKQLNSVLQETDPKRLAELCTVDFSETIARLCARIDYLHPFPEINSRPLRTFTGQLAHKVGYVLDWSYFSRDFASRERLYTARDRAVNEIAASAVSSDQLRERLAEAMQDLQGHPTLPQLLEQAIRPARAFAFEQLPEREAVQRHPELEHSFAALHLAAKTLQDKFDGNEEAQREAIRVAKDKIQQVLDRGESRAAAKRPGSSR
jgi:cell filamentation protein